MCSGVNSDSTFGERGIVDVLRQKSVHFYVNRNSSILKIVFVLTYVYDIIKKFRKCYPFFWEINN